MDYDRWDALLHHIFKQTQGDAWFRPDEQGLSSGVALRIVDSPPQFRIFPYETPSLELFEQAVSYLNPVVAVKIRSAAVHAALAEVPPDQHSIYVDANTRIQVLDTMAQLPNADKDQSAAFIRDERVMIVWSFSLEDIIQICQDFDDRLIKLLWRSRPTGPNSSQAGSVLSAPPSVSGHTSSNTHDSGHQDEPHLITQPPPVKYSRTWYGRKIAIPTPELQKRDEYDENKDGPDPNRREAKLYAPLYNGLAAGLSLVFIGNGLKVLLVEFWLDPTYIRFALCATLPLLFCVSLFFALQIIQNVAMAIGPIAHYHENSLYYSAIRPKADPKIDNALPHITIQMPVYKESLESVLHPSFHSIKRAMQTYARQGGTSSIFVNDDGLRLLSRADRDERIAYYASHNIAWTARPRHGCPPVAELMSEKTPSDLEKGGDSGKKKGPTVTTFSRAGRFKKASNMNYGLALSLKLEHHLEELTSRQNIDLPEAAGTSASHSHGSRPGIGGRHTARFSVSSGTSAFPQPQHPGSSAQQGQHGLQYLNREGDDMSVINYSHITAQQELYAGSEHEYPPSPMLPSSAAPFIAGNLPYGAESGPATPSESELNIPIEEQALAMALTEGFAETGDRWRPWGANGRNMRIGEIILIVDSDTVVPDDCLRDAAREMAACPTVAIIQHESDVMQVAHHYFENGIAYFTHRINRCISISCANGEVAPFVGHNAFLRWKALQDAAFLEPDDNIVYAAEHASAKKSKKQLVEKIWSESNVSEDFDMALRLLRRDFIVRWATYSNGDFKEGVSLTVDDELNRWQKYAYGCDELLFNPLVQWWRKGPITAQIHRFMWSKAPLHYKISMMSYMFSYYGIAAAITISIINYVLLGFQLPTDGFYMHSFEIWLATTVVFIGSGNVGYTLLQYRIGKKQLVMGFLENIMWIPFFFLFFGGLSIPVSQAILAHLFSYNISWSATIKEVQRSNFFKEIPKILKRFWFPLLVSFVVIAGMIICATSLVPMEWRVDGSSWAVIFPLSIVVGCHVLFPIVLNPWLMVFSY